MTVTMRGVTSMSAINQRTQGDSKEVAVMPWRHLSYRGRCSRQIRDRVASGCSDYPAQPASEGRHYGENE